MRGRIYNIMIGYYIDIRIVSNNGEDAILLKLNNKPDILNCYLILIITQNIQSFIYYLINTISILIQIYISKITQQISLITIITIIK